MSNLDGIRLAVGTLTIIPTRPPQTIDQRTARTAMVIAPLAVLPIVFLAIGIGGVLSNLYLSPLVVGLTTVGLIEFGTRAIHIDGLADTVDGLGASWDRDRALEVMRSGDIGPMGALSLIIVIGIQASCLGFLLQTWQTTVVAVIALVGSRVALASGCRTGVAAARTDGLGAAVAGSVPTSVVFFLWTLLALAFGFTSGHIWFGVGFVALTAAVVFGFLAHCVKRIGGITGDILGALVEVAATVLLTVACIPIG